MLVVCIGMYPYISRMYPYVSHMLVVCIGMYPYVSRVYPYVSHMLVACIRMYPCVPCVTRILPVCYSLYPCGVLVMIKNNMVNTLAKIKKILWILNVFSFCERNEFHETCFLFR